MALTLRRCIRTFLILSLAAIYFYAYFGQTKVAHASGSLAAVGVYGQSDFTSNSTSPVSNRTFISPDAISIDSANNLYVVDPHANRAMLFPYGGKTATDVIGQPNYTSNYSSCNAYEFNQPNGIAIDSSGGLYIADTSNDRILYFAPGQNIASKVYGQPNYSSCTDGSHALNVSTFYRPTGMVLDSSGGLYVADTYDNRVLYFPAGQTSPSKVYGQPNFTSGSTVNPPNAQSLFLPNAIALDSHNNLYVSDAQNFRVLMFPSGSTTATRVYGQPNFNDNGIVDQPQQASSQDIGYPESLSVDSQDDLYISDSKFNRVLFYPSGSTIPTRVYGQPNFTSSISGVSASQLYEPGGITLDTQGNLYVSDFLNNRILKFQTNLSITSQPPSSIQPGASFDLTADIIDAGSGNVLTDYNGPVTISIKPGSCNVYGTTLSGTTTVNAVNGVATFSGLSINQQAKGYQLELSTGGITSVADTSAFNIESSPTSVPSNAPSPHTTWYFAEGHNDDGFNEYLTIEDPTTANALVNIQYLFPNSSLDRSEGITVPSRTRQTVNVTEYLHNQGLYNIDVSMVVTANVGIIAERPMYFNYSGSIPGGTDVLGATHLDTSYYFADLQSTPGYTTYLTIMNPPVSLGGQGAAQVSISYNSNGRQIGASFLTVQSGTRQTINLNQILPNAQVMAYVASSVPILVERPMYFSISGPITGGMDVIGVSTPATCSFFAEGHTGDGFTEDLIVSNPGNTAVSVNITAQTPQSSVTINSNLTVNPLSQVVVNINQTIPHNDVSLEMHGTGPFLASRQLYFRYNGSIPGGTEALGSAGLDTDFSFAEGHLGNNFSEYITFENPSSNTKPAMIDLDLYFTGPGGSVEVDTPAAELDPGQRQTINLNDTFGINSGDGDGLDVSFDVHSVPDSLNGYQAQPVLIERPMYFNYMGSMTGGTDVIGYSGY